MNLEVIKQQLITVLKKYPVTRAAVFGSFSRNEQNTDSDIDLLIELSEKFTLFQILKLERELSDTVARKIDLVEYSAIKPSIRERILKEAIPIL